MNLNVRSGALTKQIKCTPNTLLLEVLAEACLQYKREVFRHMSLFLGAKELEHSNTIRVLGLSNAQTLDLKATISSAER
jgi:hypothetical protein